MSTDENYLYPTIVAITSVMENKNIDTNYSFYIMHSKNLDEESKKKLQSLQNKYDKCQINTIDMGNEYENVYTDERISIPSYYRLALSDLLPKLNKIIWLDGDTLTFYDLSEMFSIDMNGYYYKGFLDDSSNAMDEFEIYNDHYICAGVMLVNLEELRRDKMVEKFNEFIKNNSKLIHHDQTVINVVCFKNIGILPAKYGVFNFLRTDKKIIDYLNSLRYSLKYSFDEFKEAIKDPYILHCIVKPWSSKHNDRIISGDIWMEYAKN
ncbi:MAG: glycosyltransferase family 8 protein [Oscillospiraceae bacterium]|jgi:lipopolysaccharide biosynthesis glycosyltransferase|nr:glycosyltransferase family 8 protein [Oscillospiraceae bacterium]